MAETKETAHVEPAEMLRVPAGRLEELFYDVLRSRAVQPEAARMAAKNFTQTSLDGVYSHGVNRFARIVDYLDRGIIDGNAEPSCVARFGSIERWDGNGGLGNVNAHLAMDRACQLAREAGVGLVAIGNTNHWLRGGAYGWQAANQGMMGICWTNTMPNTPAWGGQQARIGNNPFIMAIPQSGGRHVVVDCAMSQFAYGKVEMAHMKGEQLPFVGGWDARGELTRDPGEIMQTMRLLPMGYWKGSGLSIVLDLMGAILSGGNTVTDIGRKYDDEIGLSQVLVAIHPEALGTAAEADAAIARVVEDIKSATPTSPDGHIYYPGELEWLTRQDNLQNGVPVLGEVWQTIRGLQR